MVTFATAEALLASVVAEASDQGIPLPERRYVSDGAPAIDCDQVTVHVIRSFHHGGDVTVQGASPIVGQASNMMRGIEVAVTLARCVPTLDDKGRPPAETAINASASTILGDIDLVAAALRRYAKSTGCSSLAMSGWVALDPSGGFGGGQTLALVSLV